MLLCLTWIPRPIAAVFGVKPIVHRNYNGSDIVLPDDPAQVITTGEHPYLKGKNW